MAHRRTTEDAYRQIVAATRRRLRINPCRSTSELAGAVPCSKRTLNRAFAAAGSTVREERDAARLDRAANVLLAEKPAGEAARHARYASPRQLADPFRRRFGVTPAHMRRIGRAVRTVRWQAGRPGPYSGSWQQRERNRTWRAQRRLLLEARDQLVAGTMPTRTVERALKLALPRPRKPQAPLTLYQVFGPAATYVPEELLHRHAQFLRRAA